MTSPEQNNAAIRQTPNADDRWRALAVSKAGARAESRAIAAQSDASYTIATAAVPSRVSASSWYVMPARHQPNRISGCSRECLPTTTHCRGSSASADHRLESAESIQRLTEFEMKLKFARLSTAILGCAAALVFPASVASADPPDPHQPDMTKGYCPGGRWGFGDLAVCDGEKYPDGSFWHQWMQTWFTGPQFYFDCVSGGEPLPGPPPPGGCGGAIPSEQPNAP